MEHNNGINLNRKDMSMPFEPEQTDDAENESNGRPNIDAYARKYREEPTFRLSTVNHLRYSFKMQRLKEYDGITLAQLNREASLYAEWIFRQDIEVSLASRYGVQRMSDMPLMLSKNNNDTLATVKFVVVRRSETLSMKKGHSTRGVLTVGVRQGRLSASSASSLHVEVSGIDPAALYPKVSVIRTTIEKHGDDQPFVERQDYVALGVMGVREALHSDYIENLWNLVKRILTEHEIQRSGNGPVTALYLRAAASVFRGKQVRIVLAGREDVVGAINGYSLGRSGVMNVTPRFGLEAEVPRSSVRNIVPWEWTDNEIRFESRPFEVTSSVFV